MHRDERYGEKLATPDTTIADLIGVSQQVIRNEWEVIRDQFDRNEVELVHGGARFIDSHTVEVTNPGSTVRRGPMVRARPGRGRSTSSRSGCGR